MNEYVMVAKIPGRERIRGARRHSSISSVREQLLATAPQWRVVFPGIEFAIEPESESSTESSTTEEMAA